MQCNMKNSHTDQTLMISFNWLVVHVVYVCGGEKCFGEHSLTAGKRQFCILLLIGDGHFHLILILDSYFSRLNVKNNLF